MVNTAETISASVLAILAIAVPVVCIVAVLALLIWATRKAGRLLFGARRNSVAQKQSNRPL